MDIRIDITEDNQVSLEIEGVPVDMIFAPKQALVIGAALVQVAHQADPSAVQKQEESEN